MLSETSQNTKTKQNIKYNFIFIKFIILYLESITATVNRIINDILP